MNTLKTVSVIALICVALFSFCGDDPASIGTAKADKEAVNAICAPIGKDFNTLGTGLGLDESNRVTYLNLTSEGLNSLASDIGHLTALKTLNLNKNNLTTLPSAIGDLSALETLSVTLNNIASLPDSIVKLDSLKVLDIWYNNLADVYTHTDKIIFAIDSIVTDSLGQADTIGQYVTSTDSTPVDPISLWLKAKDPNWDAQQDSAASTTP